MYGAEYGRKCRFKITSGDQNLEIHQNDHTSQWITHRSSLQKKEPTARINEVASFLVLHSAKSDLTLETESSGTAATTAAT